MTETAPDLAAGTDPTPAERRGRAVDGVEVLGALSPSRAGDFVACPLLYRFRTIDRLPEPSSPAAARGTLVHKVLELLFDEPAAQRTVDHASDLLDPCWRLLLEQDPSLADLVDDDPAALEQWLASAQVVLGRYFDLEDPTRLEPARRELYVETLLESRLVLRGFIDRVDVAPDGAVRIVDYKTGRAPGPGFEAKALFQMRFYALAWWREHGVVPTELALVYLGSGEVLRYRPDEHDLRATERKVEAIWAAIRAAEDDGDWQPSPSGLCAWCAHQALCPAYGGTPPPLPGRELPAG